MANLKAASLIALLLVSCTTGTGDVFFPEHSRFGPAPMAILEGRLAVETRCVLVVVANGSRVLPIWPSAYSLGSSANGLQILDASGKVVATEGDDVRLVGGQTPNLDGFGRDAVPSGCAASSFWLTYEVQRRPPASR